ncbi:phosphomannomutase [Cystoisospora suis]|uniref:Phosphomannomutase n=1 Tax=Cystoisospora suis TaxID=483139 RepID=A0A2C6KQ90_9APIC|nr:phosphomannomutase [Cystoisospora suis]
MSSAPANGNSSIGHQKKPRGVEEKAMVETGSSGVCVIFDLDGTLTKARQPASVETLDLIKELREKKKIAVAIVSGSDESKIIEQLRFKSSQDFRAFDFVFCENGCVAYEEGRLVEKLSIAAEIGEERLKEVINFCLRYIADLDIPIKRGTFVEYRNGLLNISPIGRDCTLSERLAFFELDKRYGYRKKMKSVLEENFSKYSLCFSIGGQISIDCYPEGWDKRMCLRHLESRFEKLYFFGDQTHQGGNDYEIFSDPRTDGRSVKNPEETFQILRQLFFSS